MFARVLIAQQLEETGQEQQEQQEQEVRRAIDELVIPTFRHQKGFKKGYWLGDRQKGRILAVTLWETEEDLLATEEVGRQLGDQMRQRFGTGFDTTVETYEVLAEA